MGIDLFFLGIFAIILYLIFTDNDKPKGPTVS